MGDGQPAFDYVAHADRRIHPTSSHCHLQATKGCRKSSSLFRVILMRKVILVTSVIYPDLDSPLEHGFMRSKFQPSERLIQTVGTFHSLLLQQPNAQILFCDASIPDFAEFFRQFFPQCGFLHLHKVDAPLAHLVRSCNNKTIGECHMLLSLWKAFRKEISEADFVLKATGRYLYENLNDNYFTTDNLNRYLFQTEMPSDVRDWVDHRGFNWALARSVKNPTVKRHVLRTILYGFGRFKVSKFFASLFEILFRLGQPAYKVYDIENMLPYVLAEDISNKELVRTDWRCLGWNGVNGSFFRM